jgi:hypothetical protein
MSMNSSIFDDGLHQSPIARRVCSQGKGRLLDRSVQSGGTSAIEWVREWDRRLNPFDIEVDLGEER